MPKCLQRTENCSDSNVQKKVSELSDKDFIRLPKFSEREEIQKAKFNLPLFPTTTIGSFPQTADVRENRRAFKKGEISEEQYVSFNKKKLLNVLLFKKKSVLTSLYTVNLSATTWLNISVNALTALFSLKKRGCSLMAHAV
jgi:hypothetical protein